VAEGLFVELATTGTRYNIAEVPRLIEFAAQLHVNWFMLYNFIPTGRGADIAKVDLSPDEREEVLKLCWNRMKLGGVEVLSTAPQFARVAQETEAKALIDVREGNADGLQREGEQAAVVPTHFYNPKFSGQLKQLAEFVGGCGAGRFYICLEPNGDIYPCVFFPHEPAMRVGNLLKDDFGKVWRRSELFWKLRDKDKLRANCGSCRFRYTCGGCRARAYSYFRDVLAPDPGCVRNRNAWQTVQLNVKARKRAGSSEIGA
jgi:radical SAM protein with 4Fe4S-binding SPASM domain